MPPFFEVDLDGLEIGATIHMSSVTLPDGIKPVIADRDFTVATIQGAVKQEVEETPSEADAAADVDDQEKTEGDAATDADGDDKK